MATNILYQSKEKTRNSRETRYKENISGNETEINSYIASLSIGSTQKEGLYLSSWRKSQIGGDLWQVECEYAELDNWISYSSLPDSLVGVKSSTMSVRTLQLPLENLSNYKQNWNHYLIVKTQDGQDVETPSWWSNLQYGDFVPSQDRDNWRIINSLSEIPLQPQGKDSNGHELFWQVNASPTKPGVEYYDFCVYTVTELARYRTAQDAGTAIDKNINKITSPSNTFGISGGNWKLDESSVQFDGNAWNATNVYTHSPTGWDTDLYQHATSSSSSNSSSSAN